jgi:hypothetical protein
LNTTRQGAVALALLVGAARAVRRAWKDMTQVVLLNLWVRVLVP